MNKSLSELRSAIIMQASKHGYKVHSTINLRESFALFFKAKCNTYVIMTDGVEIVMDNVTANLRIAENSGEVMAYLEKGTAKMHQRYGKTQSPAIMQILRNFGLTCPKVRSRRQPSGAYWYSASGITWADGAALGAGDASDLLGKVATEAFTQGWIVEDMTEKHIPSYRLRFRTA